MGNLLQQDFSVEDLGKYKVDVLADKYIVNTEKRFMTEDDFDKFDVIFSCVDSMELRKSLYNHKLKEGAFWIDGRTNSNIGMVFNSQIPFSKLERYISDDTERGGCLLQYEKEQKISHTLPLIVASMMVQVFLQATRGKFVTAEKMITL